MWRRPCARESSRSGDVGLVWACQGCIHAHMTAGAASLRSGHSLAVIRRMVRNNRFSEPVNEAVYFGYYNDADFTVEETTGWKVKTFAQGHQQATGGQVYPRLGGSRVKLVWKWWVSGLLMGSSYPYLQRPLRCDLSCGLSWNLHRRCYSSQGGEPLVSVVVAGGGVLLQRVGGQLGKLLRGGSEAKQNVASDLHPPGPSPAWALPTPERPGGFRGSRESAQLCVKSQHCHSLELAGRRALGAPLNSKPGGVNSW